MAVVVTTTFVAATTTTSCNNIMAMLCNLKALVEFAISVSVSNLAALPELVSGFGNFKGPSLSESVSSVRLCVCVSLSLCLRKSGLGDRVM